MSLWEFKIVDASNWEFSQLHAVLKDLQQHGWRLESSVEEPGATPRLRLVLRRERQVSGL